jgi:hypothetical protein
VIMCGIAELAQTRASSMNVSEGSRSYIAR